ncbi:MAG: acyltransferase family protein [Anaerolineales bacterium]|nr:acyltransferase family protein [Anaerolineales bacterium]
MKRYDQLTFTRFWALLLVLIYHGAGGIYLGYINKFPLSPILGSAPTGVSYLYVLSGFVMALVYYRPGEKFELVKYWMARVVRIYPLYIISFILVCYYYLEALPHIKPQKILANIFVLQAWFPQYSQSFNYASWSMTVEFFFYAVFPFFVLWAYRQPVKRILWVSVIFWIITQTVNFILWIGYFPQKELTIVYNPIFHLSSFFLGVAGGAWFIQEAQHQKIDQKVNFSILIFSLGLVAGYTILSSVFPQMPHNLQPMSGLLAPFFVLFISTLALDTTRLSKILSHRWLVTLGETSFALYILHVPVIWLYERALESSGLSNPGYIKDVTYLPLMISVGLIANYYIDPPIRNWMKKILNQISLPLLLLDLAIITASIFISFRFRFGDGREYLSYRQMGILVFWSAFFFRTIISYLANTFNPNSLYLPPLQMIRRLAIAVGGGSLVVASIIFAGYKAGWYINFPRSVFVVDFFVIFLLSFSVRYLFRVLKIYQPIPTAN